MAACQLLRSHAYSRLRFIHSAYDILQEHDLNNNVICWQWKCWDWGIVKCWVYVAGGVSEHFVKYDLIVAAENVYFSHPFTILSPSVWRNHVLPNGECNPPCTWVHFICNYPYPPIMGHTVFEQTNYTLTHVVNKTFLF